VVPVVPAGLSDEQRRASEQYLYRDEQKRLNNQLTFRDELGNRDARLAYRDEQIRVNNQMIYRDELHGRGDERWDEPRQRLTDQQRYSGGLAHGVAHQTYRDDQTGIRPLREGQGRGTMNYRDDHADQSRSVRCEGQYTGERQEGGGGGRNASSYRRDERPHGDERTEDGWRHSYMVEEGRQMNGADRRIFWDDM
jgi:hypothetical protein